MVRLSPLPSAVSFSVILIALYMPPAYALRNRAATLSAESPDGAVENPLLNHLALLVDSYKEHVENAERHGLEYEEVDAANTWAVFVTGPYGIRIEYVEHKPGFALK